MARNLNLKEKRIGLALGGGGARGVAHIGIIKALQRANIPIHAVVGTSVGALIGGWYATHGEVDSLENMFLKINKKDIVSSTRLFLKRDGVLFKDPAMERVIEGKMKGKFFKDSNIPFAVIATDIKTGDEVIIKEGLISEAVRASIAVPFVFKPVSLHGKLLMDGGLSNPIAVDVVKNMGVDIVIAVDVSRGWINFVDENLTDIPKMVDKMMMAIQYQIARKQLRDADIILRPEVEAYTWLDFHRAAELVRAGREEVERKLPDIHKITGYDPVPLSMFSKFMDFIFRE